MKYAPQKCDETLKFQNMSSYQKLFEANTEKALTIIRSRLQAVLETKPLSNKLLTRVLIFRYQRASENNITDLKDVS